MGLPELIWQVKCLSSTKVRLYYIQKELMGIMAGNNKRTFTVVIIGGGFSGASVTAALLRAGNSSLSVILIEREGQPGLGVAYGTPCSGHLLNVRAQNMSAVAEDPLHFLHWVRLHYDCSAQPDDYLPRQVYGRYVQAVLKEAGEASSAHFEWKHDEAVAITAVNGKVEISLHSGSTIVADKVVLALGNFPPADPKFPGKTEFSPRYISNPWDAHTIEEIGKGEDVLLVGSGLTSVDVVITLRERGHQGKVHILSRHGFLPQTHKHTEPWPAFWNEESPRTALGLLRLIRSEIGKAEANGGDWRAVIDSLRPFNQKIWRSLPRHEQMRFLRHLRAYWDVHRHRVAPQIGQMLAGEMGKGNVEVHAGRITNYSEDLDHIVVTYHERTDGESKTVRVERVINCTGPDANIRRIQDPLLKNLFQHNLVQPDAISLGLDTAESGAILDNRGVASDFIYTLGPLRKGNLWESIAVPEIRVQASQLAIELISSIERVSSKTNAHEVDLALKGIA
jgi:uncharacterized NAD(P)/FAD-binding protein YdhS